MLSGHGVLAGPLSFLITSVTHKKEEHCRVVMQNQLTPRKLSGHIGMSRDKTNMLNGHRVLAGPMEFPRH